MSGIIGLVGPEAEGCGERLEQARDLMYHRGPDQAGLWGSPGVLLGSRRLAILDLSAAGSQPMLSPDGRLALVFDGEIYNYRELRRELEGSYRFRSHTDSEVLLAGFKVWGWEELLRRIDGMFAFAIWDTQTQTLYAARDRVGKKPFFYALTPKGLVFASTLNALRVLLPDTPKLDPVAIDTYLTYWAVHAPLTVFQRVRQLLPAQQLVFKLAGRQMTLSRYWDVHYAPKRREGETATLETLDGLVRQAVRKRLMSDVPVGAFLSGGVDSSLVVAMMAQEVGQVEAVTVGYEEPNFDERRFARQMAERLGVRLHEHVLRPHAAVADLPEIVWQCDQPLASSLLPAYFVAQAAKPHVTVMLSGDGGDAVFGQLRRPQLERAAMTYRRMLPWEGLRRRLGRRLGGYRRGPLGRLALLAEAGQFPAKQDFYSGLVGRAKRSYLEVAYTSEFQRTLAGWHPDMLYDDVWESAVAEDDVDRVLYSKLVNDFPYFVLAKLDALTMAHSVEARSPFLDTALIEYSAGIPTNLRLRGNTNKYLLKRLAERYLPHEVIYRRKMGFVAPFADWWLRGELAPYVEAALQSPVLLDRGWLQPKFVTQMLSEWKKGRSRSPIRPTFFLSVWLHLLEGELSRDDSLEALLEVSPPR
jgi:asparagine synthase (glutamine-hydrolysing)